MGNLLRACAALVLVLAASVAAAQPFTQAFMTAPAPGSTLSGSVVQFKWAPIGRAHHYELIIGTSPGNDEFVRRSLTQAGSYTAQYLPTDGSKVYVRLTTSFNGTSAYEDYVYTAMDSLSKASMTAPAPDSTLSGSAVQFSWDPVKRSHQYELIIGTSPGNDEIFRKSQTQVGYFNVVGLPTDGSKVYVRLVTSFEGRSVYEDYVYTTASGAVQPPTLEVAFSAATTSVNQPVGMMLALTNPNDSTDLTNVAFSDNLPVGLELTGSRVFSGGCQPPSTPVLSSGEPTKINLSGLVLRAKAYCVWEVSVAATTPGTKVNTVTVSAAGTGTSTSTATLLAVAPTAEGTGGGGAGSGGSGGGGLGGASSGGGDGSATESTTCSGAPFGLLVGNWTFSYADAGSVGIATVTSALNDNHWTLIPITLHADGTFEGSKSATEVGKGDEYLTLSQGTSKIGFKQTISLQASGMISRGRCTGSSCAPDTMHLTLSGTAGPQSTDLQAQFPGRSVTQHEVTQGGTGSTLEFELPAYIGRALYRHFSNAPTLLSLLDVKIAPIGGTVQQGASLLPPAECGAHKSAPTPATP
jgi:hypothetical protein